MSARDLIILGCSSQQPTRDRNHGAYLFRWNGMGLLFDPGEGTQRQLIFAGVAPPTVTHMFISHFHGDHCLGVGSMLMRLNLDNVTHPIHCYYPASGKKYFDRLRYSTMYHERIQVIEHPVERSSEKMILVEEGPPFRIEAAFLEHGVDTIGWRITEPDKRKFSREALNAHGIKGPMVKKLEVEGFLNIDGRVVNLDDVSEMRQGDSIAVVLDTRPVEAAVHLANGVRLLLCESTYLDRHRHLAEQYKHLTAKDAAKIALDAHAELLVLTHYSARYVTTEEFVEEAKEIFPHVIAADDLMYIPFPVHS